MKGYSIPFVCHFNGIATVTGLNKCFAYSNPHSYEGGGGATDTTKSTIKLEYNICSVFSGFLQKKQVRIIGYTEKLVRIIGYTDEQ